MRQRAKNVRSVEPPPLRLEPRNEWVWCGERRLELTPKEFAVLRYLLEHPGRLITKDELLTAVWGDTVVSEAALTSCIRDLRRALGDSSRVPRYIETVHRRGFRFIGRIGVSSAAVAAHAPGIGGEAAASPDRPLLVGREVDLARLRAFFETATAGRRQVVFVTGEAGIGKTTLVEAFLAQLRTDERLRVGRGQCVEQYGVGEAYLPVLEALGRMSREAHGNELVSTLRRFAPTWLVQLPALLSDSEFEAVQQRVQGATRERMLRELVEAFDALASEVPFVLVLEDLHWSDSATVDLLAMLARRPDPARLLIVATYRPADVTAATHPLRSVKQELQIHGQCEELLLEFLDEAAVQAYLDRRFRDGSFPPRLARALHRSTSGNPLFLVTVVDDLVLQGRLHPVDERWELTAAVDEVTDDVPHTLRQLVERQIERLTPEEQAILAVGAVAGADFSAALAPSDGIEVAAGEHSCTELARRGQFLRVAGVTEWPDGTVAGRYAFIHALYRNVLYARVPIGLRVGLHLRIGARLEQAYGARTREIAGELAMHFEHGRDFERAVTCRRQAAHTALRQHGYVEAADHAQRALALVEALADSPARIEHELVAHMQLGTAFTAMKGWAAPEVARSYERARELCMLAGDRAQTFPVLLALSRSYLSRGQLGLGREMAERASRLVTGAQDRVLRLWADNMCGLSSFYAGDFATALVELERGMAVYDRQQHSLNRSPAFEVGHDPGVSCAVHAAWALWLLGYPDRAATRMRDALSLAHAVDHPFTLGFACHYAATFHCCRHERDPVRELVDEAARLSNEYGFGLFMDVVAILRGWLLAGDARSEDAFERIREGLAAYGAKGTALARPTFVGILADVAYHSGRSQEGLAFLTEELAPDRPGSLVYWDADLHRWKGELALAAGAQADAEACFEEALAIARRQQAKAFELRAAMSLGRLWQRQGKTQDAIALLSPIYGWFTEGFDTRDLRDAKALLDELTCGSRKGSPARPRRS